MQLNLFNKIKKTFFEKIETLFKKTDDDYIISLTNILIESDVEINLTDEIINILKKKNITTLANLKTELYSILKTILKDSEKELIISNNLPLTILVIGVNGVGKTTTVVKLANFFKKQNKKVLVAAGDTYRAAGIEQLDYICKKNDIPIMKQHSNADSASVIFDALNVAKSKNIDILIADTSGRLNTNEKLMTDLRKIDKSLKKIDITAPNEVLMVIDSNFGQNSITQVKKFNDYIKLTGIILTKTDNTAKGGIIFSFAKNKIPIKFICNGENINDISIFNSDLFLRNLLNM